MKKFLTLATLAMSILTLNACDPISGQLQVVRSFGGSTQDDTCSGDDDMRPSCIGPRSVELQPGTYGASIEYISSSQLAFTVNVGGSDRRQMTLKIPSGKVVPNYSGPISLSSSQSGQPFDVKGEINTKESDSEQSSGIESCTWTEEREHCGGPRRECHVVTITHHGSHQVEYHYHYTNTKLALQILSPSAKSLLGKFNGRRDSTAKVYDYDGPCN